MINTRLAVLWIALLPLAALGQTYAVDSDGSNVLIHVGKTGLGSFAGHEHDIAARSLRGKVIVDREDISRSSVDVVFEAIALKVVGKGEPPEDIPKVQSEMQGPKVLDVKRFPTIRFSSRSVGGSQVSPASTISGSRARSRCGEEHGSSPCPSRSRFAAIPSPPEAKHC